MAKYRKKPVVIEAFEYDGDMVDRNGMSYVPMWARQALEKGVMFYEAWDLFIKTLEGKMLANVGDYIIQGVQGEIYPCKPDIFKATYDEVPDEEATNE